MANYFCGNCGTEHGPADVFCRNCGAPIMRQQEQPIAQPPAAPALPTAQIPPQHRTSSYTQPSIYPEAPVVPAPIVPTIFAYQKPRKRTWPKVLGIVAGVMALLVIGVVLLVAFWPKPDPQVAINGARKAFTDHDEQAFEENVDVDAVLGDAIDQNMSYAASRMTQGGSQGERVGGQIGGAVVAQIFKSQEMNELHSDVQQLVSGVAVDSQNSNQDPASAYLVPVMHSLLQAGLTYQSCNVITQSRSTAEVAVNLQPALGGPVELDLRLSFEDGRWKIVSLEHLDQLLAKYQSVIN